MQSPLFQLLSQKSSWLAQRQAVLARNVANADTPGARAFDIAPFEKALRTEMTHPPAVELAVTRAGHAQGRPAPESSPRPRRSDSYEIAPSGNAIVLEEQMQKIADTRLEHQLGSELYGKYLRMVRTALGIA